MEHDLFLAQAKMRWVQQSSSTGAVYHTGTARARTITRRSALLRMRGRGQNAWERSSGRRGATELLLSCC